METIVINEKTLREAVTWKCSETGAAEYDVHFPAWLSRVEARAAADGYVIDLRNRQELHVFTGPNEASDTIEALGRIEFWN
jgi:hypothetical protein